MLVKRLTVRGDDDADAVALASARTDLSLYAERMGVAASHGFDVAATDERGARAMRDVMLARLRRASFQVAPVIIEHDCPHVAGYEEAIVKPCSSPEYGLTETAV
jgi:hypothetical protein